MESVVSSLPAVKVFERRSAEKLDKSGWIHVGKLLDEGTTTKPIQVSKDEFVVATKFNPHNKTRYPGVWAYNCNKKCWKYICKYDENIVGAMYYAPKITYNPKTFDLYLYSHDNHCMLFAILCRSH